MTGFRPPGGIPPAPGPPRSRNARPSRRLLPLLLILPIFTTCDPLGTTGPNVAERLSRAVPPVASPVTGEHFRALTG